MRWLTKRLTGTLLLLLAATFVPPAAVAQEPAGTLVSAMTERLQLMEGVAQYKWNNKIAIEDLARERQVLDGVVTTAQEQGVSVELATAFFQAQIEAAKMIQTRLFETWQRTGAGPFPDAPDLVEDVRPAITSLTGRIIAALAQLEAGGAGSLCAALDRVPPALAEDADAWRTATAPLRERIQGC